MQLRTDDMRVVDLADEFGITISETLALCKMFDIPAPYGSSQITPAGAELLRGLARGEINPESVDSATLAEARGPDYQPASATAPSLKVNSTTQVDEAGSDGFDQLRDRPTGADEPLEDDYDYGDPDDYDSYGVAGLDDFRASPSDEAWDDVAGHKGEGSGSSDRIVLPVEPTALRDTALRDTALGDTADGTEALAGNTNQLATAAPSSLSAARAAHVVRAPERRKESPRRSRDKTEDREKKEYDPSSMRAEYDDIDKYVPKWLKFVALGALGVFGFLAYQLFFAGSVQTVEDGPQQTPVYFAGDCFNADVALWIDTMATTSCAAEHDGEIFDSFTLVGELGVPYPEPAASTSQARQACRGTFSQYTGQSSVVSDYRIGISLPTSIEWAKGDRIAYCSTISLDGTKLTGSTARS